MNKFLEISTEAIKSYFKTQASMLFSYEGVIFFFHIISMQFFSDTYFKFILILIR